MASLSAKKSTTNNLSLLSAFVAEMDAAKAAKRNNENYLEDKLWINFEAFRVSAGEHANTYIPWIAKKDDGTVIDSNSSFCIDTDEPMRGNIKPMDTWGEEEEKIAFPNHKKVEGKGGLRGDFKPAIQIQKYTCKVEEVNGQVVKLPSDDKISVIYRFIEHVKFVFEYSLNKMMEIGDEFFKSLKNKKEININVFKGKCMMMTTSDKNDAIEFEHPNMNSNEIQDFIKQHAIVIKSKAITKMIQKRTKDGKVMNNPMTRFNLAFDPKTGEAKFNAFNTSKTRRVKLPNGNYKAVFQPLTYKGKSINTKNVHLLIRSGYNIRGSIFKLDTICASSMGNSVMMPFDTVNVKPYVPKPKYDATAACDLGVLDAESVANENNSDEDDACESVSNMSVNAYTPDGDDANPYDED